MKWLKCKGECCGCGACAQICPKKCIYMQADEEGFLYPSIDKSLCIKCGLCEGVCPILHRQERNYIEQAYAASSRDTELLRKSSSGGMFGVLARNIILKDGIVFGCCFNEEMEAVHCSAKNELEYEKFHGSKYVQSNTGQTYEECREYLEKGRYVLYTGTPCQIAGLKLFLQKDYPQLITAEVICHGVPSPGLWEKYISELEKIKRKKIVNAAFRYQDQGWRKFRFRTVFEDGTDEVIQGNESSFFHSFSNNLTLRPSCYNCKCRLPYSKSDFLIGDFWGVEKYNTGLNEDLGISALAILSEKGEKVFQEIKEQITYVNVKMKEIASANGCIYLSTFPNRNRSQLYDIYKESENVMEAMERYAVNYKWEQKQYRIGVWGSYNSRLISQFLISNSTLKRAFHYSNSSIISLMSDKEILNAEIVMENQYRMEALIADWNKSFREQFDNVADKVDYILLDLLEERFGLFQCDNTYITDSDALRDWKSQTAMVIIGQEELISNGIWEKKMQQFVSMLQSKFDASHIILAEIYLNELYKDGECLYNFDEQEEIRRTNQTLHKLYKLFKECCPEAQVVTLQDELQYTDINHRYGCYPYHFNYKAYFALADQIFNIMVESNE